MFTQVEVANQWHCRAHNNLFFLLYSKQLVLFVCEQDCEQLTQELIENGKRNKLERFVHFYHKMRNRPLCSPVLTITDIVFKAEAKTRKKIYSLN